MCQVSSNMSHAHRKMEESKARLVVSGGAQQDRLQLCFLNAARHVCLQNCAQVGREPWASLEIRLAMAEWEKAEHHDRPIGDRHRRAAEESYWAYSGLQ
ncbi:hypothetical protein PO909_020833 [Leuciscus waleckii]